MKEKCQHRVIMLFILASLLSALYGFQLYQTNQEEWEICANVQRVTLQRLTWNQSSVSEINLLLNRCMHVSKEDAGPLLRAWKQQPHKEAGSFIPLDKAIKAHTYLWTLISSQWVRHSLMLLHVIEKVCCRMLCVQNCVVTTHKLDNLLHFMVLSFVTIEL